MRRLTLVTPLAAAALVAAILAPVHATAQSDVLLRLRSGSPLGDRFRVDSSSAFVAKGVLGVGVLPYTGAGERLTWDPFHASFRAGSIGSAGTQWDLGNTGFYTWAGGYNTIALGLSSFAMGYASTALGSYALALGYTANADGTGAVALGYRVTADADYSVAIGQRASTNGHAGAIVLSDGSTTDSTQASANNQFTVRSAGGIRLFTNATMTTGVQVAAGGSSWSVISDRNRKQDFMPVSGEDLLARLRGIPVTTWRLRTEEDRTVRHIGPMAQDWHRAFGFNSDSTTINMSDFDGVNLAAIQALDARTTELQTRTAEVARLRAEVQARTAETAQLRTDLDATRRKLEELETLVHQMQASHH